MAKMKARLRYQLKQVCPVLLMMAALCWLTISTPFVYSAQLAAMNSSTHSGGSTETNKGSVPNPFANTTEEKTESGANIFSEYLHDIGVQVDHVTSVLPYFKCQSSDLYYAFHPELISPPPEA